MVGIETQKEQKEQVPLGNHGDDDNEIKRRWWCSQKNLSSLFPFVYFKWDILKVYNLYILKVNLAQ